jgi:hypothetical protein
MMRPHPWHLARRENDRRIRSHRGARLGLSSGLRMPAENAKPWTPLLRCPTWHHAHQAAASMHRGGVLLRTHEPPPLGSGVHLTLRLPDGNELVLVGDVVELMAAEGAVVRFRVASPLLAQLETRAWKEDASSPRAARPPLARGSVDMKAVVPVEEAEEEAGTTYSIHRRPPKRPTKI